MNEQATMMMNQQQQLINMNQNLMSMNQMNTHQQQPQMVPVNRSYGMWPSQPPQFQNPNPGAMKPQPQPAFNMSLGPRNSWKGKKVNKSNDKRRKEKSLMAAGSSNGGMGGVNVISGSGVGNSNFNSYKPPNLNELQHQNRLKARKFFPKKKFNKNNSMNMNTGINNSRSAPYAPRNTTSFLIRAKKSGGIAPLVSPCPVTPAVLPTPIFSPSKEILVDMAKEEWGVDGYGSMKGLIRLRSSGLEMEALEDDDEDEGGSSDSDVEEHVEVERRLDHDLSRFEMIYNPNNGMEYHNVLENRVDDQDSHIAQLEEENLILKERLFLMEREFADLRRRMQCLERRGEDINEENESENESDIRGEEEAHSMEDFGEENVHSYRCYKGKGDYGHIAEVVELDTKGKVENDNRGLDEADNNINVGCEEQSYKNSVKLIEGDKNKKIAVDADINENNKCVNEEVKVEDNVEIESSENATVEGDACMEDGGIARENNMVLERDVADSGVTKVK